MKGLIPLMIVAGGSWIIVAEQSAIAKPLWFSPVIQAQNTQNQLDVTVTQKGAGTYSLNNRFRGTITLASVKVSDNGKAELTFQNSDDQLVRFQGEVIRQDPYRIRVNLTESDVLNATGVADIQYDANLSLIYSIFVAGTVENQMFSINFSR